MEELEEYIAGYLFGDGNLYYDKSRRAYCIRMYDVSREHLIAIARIICKQYGVKIFIYSRFYKLQGVCPPPPEGNSAN